MASPGTHSERFSPLVSGTYGAFRNTDSGSTLRRINSDLFASSLGDFDVFYTLKTTDQILAVRKSVAFPSGHTRE